jgi:hypothetical protein
MKLKRQATAWYWREGYDDVDVVQNHGGFDVTVRDDRSEFKYRINSRAELSRVKLQYGGNVDFSALHPRSLKARFPGGTADLERESSVWWLQCRFAGEETSRIYLTNKPIETVKLMADSLIDALTVLRSMVNAGA